MAGSKPSKEQLIQALGVLHHHVAQPEGRGSGQAQHDYTLWEKSDFLAVILDNTGVLVVVLDLQGRIVRFNRACEHLSGYTTEEVRGQLIWDTLLTPEEAPRVQNVLAQLSPSGSTNTHESWWRTKEGQVRRLAWANTVLLNPLGQIAYIVSIGIDITARRQAEMILEEREARTRAILETAVDGIITIGVNGIIESFNPAAERLFGHTAADIIGQDVSLLMPSPYREEHSAYLKRYLRTGEKRIIGVGREVIGLRRDGTTFPLALTVSEVRLGERQIFTGIVHDLTERKRAEQEMQRADRLALVGQLASGLAHEIGTPLNVIAGNAELLRMNLRERGKTTFELDTIIAQADRITRLIEQLLTFARAQGQHRHPLALHEPLTNALRLLETRFKREAIAVVVDVPSTLPLVCGAADELEQVFLNVLVNAWHAMPHGGTMTIQASACHSQQNQIVFQDTGLGMPEADLHRAFEPFFTTKGGKGTGLGLAICKQIIDSHGGTLTLDSTPGQGTTVTIMLPWVTNV